MHGYRKRAGTRRVSRTSATAGRRSDAGPSTGRSVMSKSFDAFVVGMGPSGEAVAGDLADALRGRHGDRD